MWTQTEAKVREVALSLQGRGDVAFDYESRKRFSIAYGRPAQVEIVYSVR